MEIKGFGSYTSVEKHLATLSVDEKNELFLSGELDRMLDDAERESEVQRETTQSKSFASIWEDDQSDLL